MNVDTIKKVWHKLENDGVEGLVKIALDVPSALKSFCTFNTPEKIYGIAFSFHQVFKVDVSIFQDLSELEVALINDASFPKSQLLLIQLVNKESRVFDIFASICANIVSSIHEAESEKEAVQSVITQMRKWKDLFSKRKGQKLSTQEQQGLFGELVFLRKLLLSSIDKVAVASFWVGPNLVPKDFQSDMWAVEVKTTLANSRSGILINGEQQLDETAIAKLYLCNIVVDLSEQSGQLLPEIIAMIRQQLEGENKALTIFESQLMRAGYFDIDEECYYESHYHIRKVQYFLVEGKFPRVKKNDLRLGVSGVKYNISLNFSEEYMVTEENVIKTIESYEGNK